MDYIKNKRLENISRIQNKIAKLECKIVYIQEAQRLDEMRLMGRAELIQMIRGYIFPFLMKSMGHGLRFRVRNIEIRKRMLGIYNDRYELDLMYEELYPEGI